MLAFLKKYYFVFITLLLCLVVFAIDFELRSNVDKTNERIFRLEQLRNQIIYYDEALTMTARIAALTNDPALEERYNKFAILIDTALIDLKNFAGDEKSRSGAKETDEANQQLIAIEEDAFALIKKGDNNTAIENLFSENYEQQKQIYARGMASLDSSVKDRLASLNSDIENYNYIKTATLFFTVIFLLVVAISAIRSKNSLKEREASLSVALLEAQSSERAKAQFLAKVSHEIRTPLNGIYGLAQVFERDNLDAEQLKFLDLIMDSCNSLAEVINDVLDFSALESGKMKLTHEKFDLQTELTNLIHIYTHLAEAKNVKLQLDFDKSCPSNLVGDYLKIKQVLVNLIGNALKFTENGSVVLRVSGRENAGIAKMLFEVEDTGIGISDSNLAKIFDSFVQADNSDSRKYGGTGLGLAISKQIVELMGGKIGVESKVAVGSKFWVEVDISIAA
jgi:signal transduction histidine kinase